MQVLLQTLLIPMYVFTWLVNIFTCMKDTRHQLSVADGIGDIIRII